MRPGELSGEIDDIVLMLRFGDDVSRIFDVLLPSKTFLIIQPALKNLKSMSEEFFDKQDHSNCGEFYMKLRVSSKLIKILHLCKIQFRLDRSEAR